jgi:arylformamidase
MEGRGDRVSVPILDISPAIHPGIGVFPGDTPYRRDVLLRIADGANIELSRVSTTLHLGAHADAPSHYVGGGSGIGDRPLTPYLGACEVIRVRVGSGDRVLPRHLPGPVGAPRVLIATGTFPNPDRWNGDFAALSPELLHHLADQGVLLVGIDTPSVDPQDSHDLPSHAALAARDLAVLEGLVLRDVPEGPYTLVALPLRIVGADASPVRAVLLPPGAL